MYLNAVEIKVWRTCISEVILWVYYFSHNDNAWKEWVGVFNTSQSCIIRHTPTVCRGTRPVAAFHHTLSLLSLCPAPLTTPVLSCILSSDREQVQQHPLLCLASRERKRLVTNCALNHALQCCRKNKRFLCVCHMAVQRFLFPPVPKAKTSNVGCSNIVCVSVQCSSMNFGTHYSLVLCCIFVVILHIPVGPRLLLMWFCTNYTMVLSVKHCVKYMYFTTAVGFVSQNFSIDEFWRGVVKKV